MEQLEQSDREYFNLLAMLIVRNLVNASGVVRALGDLKGHLAGGHIQRATATVESIEQWPNGIEGRLATLEARYLM